MRFSCFNRLLILSLLFSFSAIGSTIATDSEEHPLELSAPLEEKKWTFMVYLDGDNNLEPAAIDDLNEMEWAGGTTADVNVVALVDRCRETYEIDYGYVDDTSEARYYEIIADMDMVTIASTVVQELGEVNMGSPNTLRNFVNWSQTMYPAEKYALVLWDHGGGLSGICWDEDNKDSFLSIDDLHDALEGYYIDLIGCDACVMCNFEILYELKDYCEIYCASLLNEPFDGWDYASSLGALLSNPDMNAAELGETISNTYYNSYNPHTAVAFGTYNITYLADIDQKIDNLTIALTNALPIHGTEILAARLKSTSEYPYYICDFYTFLQGLVTVPSTELQTAASSIIEVLDNSLVIFNSNIGEIDYGMLIFFPVLPYEIEIDCYLNAQDSFWLGYLNTYYGLDFALNTTWSNFLYEWRIALSSIIPTLEVDGSYNGFIEEFELFCVQANLPDPSPNEKMKITLTMDSNLNLYLEAWNEEYLLEGSNAIYIESDNGQGSPESALLSYTDETQIYFFIGNNNEQTGSFRLTLESYVDDDIFEEDDDISHATLISANASFPLISKDDDYFRIKIEKGDTIEITVNFNESLIDLDLNLHHSTLGLVDYSLYACPEIILYRAELTGYYNIQVSPSSGTLGTSYTLIVKIFELDDTSGPEITQIQQTPSSPYDNDSIEINCEVVDDLSYVDFVILSYNTSIGWFNITMSSEGSDIYSATILPQINATCIEYVIYAYDDLGNWEKTEVYQLNLNSYPTTTEDTPYPFIGILVSMMIVILVNIFKLKRKK